MDHVARSARMVVIPSGIAGFFGTHGGGVHLILFTITSWS
jgi:hypothetical protein